MANKFNSDNIINAAISLLAEHGIGVPTAKVAKQAQISNGTLFNYFPTKQNLLDKVYLAIKQEIAQQIVAQSSSNQAGIEALMFFVWQRYILWAIKNPQKQLVASLLHSSLAISEDAKSEVDQTFSFITNQLEAAQSDELIRDIPTPFLCDLAIAQMCVTIEYARTNDFTQVQLDEAIKQSFDVYWNGIKPAI